MAATVPVFAAVPVVSDVPVVLADEVGVPVRADSKDCKSVKSCETAEVPFCVIAVCPTVAEAGDEASDGDDVLLCPAVCVDVAGPLPQPPNAISAKDVFSDNVADVPPAMAVEPEDVLVPSEGSHAPPWAPPWAPPGPPNWPPLWPDCEAGGGW